MDAALATDLFDFRRFAGASFTFDLRDRVVRAVDALSVSPLSLSGTVASEPRCAAARFGRPRTEETTLPESSFSGTVASEVHRVTARAGRLRVGEATLDSIEETDPSLFSSSSSGNEIARPSGLEPKLSRFSESASDFALFVEERVPDFLVEAFESAREVTESVSDFFVAAFEAVLDFVVEVFEEASSSFFVRVAREWRVETGESWERVLSLIHI